MESNEALFRRFVDEAPNAGRLAVIDEVLAPDVRYVLPMSDPFIGRGAVRDLIQSFRSAFSDLHVEIEEIIAQGDKLAVRVRARGTNDGTFMGHPPTAQKAEWSAVHIVRFAGGQIVQDRVTFDLYGLLEQLGHASSAAVGGA